MRRPWTVGSDPGLAQQVAKTPEYVTANDKELTAELNRLPEAEEVPVICEISSVVEFYAR